VPLKPPSSPVEAVRTYVAGRWPSRSRDWHEDVAAEAMRLALEAAPRIAGKELITAAVRQVAAAAQQRRNAQRRGQQIAGKGPADDGAVFVPQRRARQPRPPRAPKGLTPIRSQRPIPDYVPTEIGDLPEAPTMLMAHRVAALLEPISDGDLISPQVAVALRKFYDKTFAQPVDNAWADLFLEELEKAKREKLQWEAAIASINAAPGLTEVTVQRTNVSDAAPERLPVKLTLVRSWGANRVLKIEGTASDGQTFSAHVRGSEIEPAAPQPYVPHARAFRVLCDVIGAIARWPTANRIPAHLVDVELVAWLIDRCAFEGGGGGGAGGTLKGSSIGRLLVDPQRLVLELRRFAARAAERGNDHEAEAITERFKAMIARVEAQIG